MSVTDVTARIGQLQAHFALLAPKGTQPSPVIGGSGTDFSAALARSGGLGSAAPGTAAAYGAAGAGAAAGRAGVDAASFGGGPSYGGPTGADVVAEARKYLGVPYVWGGTDPKQGLDCSGLVQLVYKNLGIDLPRVSYEQAEAGRPVHGGLANAKPGDILAFNSPVDHVGIYIGNGKMIEAPRTGLDVRVIDVYETPSAIRRVLPPAAARADGPGGLPNGVPYAGLFERAADRYNVDATLLAAVAKQESGYDPQAVSSAGAQGLMQLMPATAAGLGVENSFDPRQAVDGAARLLRDLLREFDRVDLALAAYNAGPGAVHRYDGIPPYPETRHYVTAVLGHQDNLESR
jgi:peptidoglycan DL-endopeptidase CwlO